MYDIDSSYKTKCWELMKSLFPVYRTLMGEGFDTSLKIINEIIPLNILKIPSGTKCGSWTIPQEWRIEKAILSDGNGKEVVSFKKNNFHIWQYSIPFKGKVTREELFNHLSFCEKSNDAIPLNIAYYSNTWGFSLTARQKESLVDTYYQVDIESTFNKGNLLIGELFLPGKSNETILIDSVLSCAQLANNLSGVIVAVYLAELISSLKERNFSYRIVFTPETIGPITLHYHCKNLLENVIGGYTLINLGHQKEFHYKRSRPSNTIADTAIIHSLKHFNQEYTTEAYDVKTGTCGNEKAYNSLGIEVPIGSFKRNPLGSYPEYDTSKDDLSFVDDETMYDSLRVLWGAIEAIERSCTYTYNFEGEPFLTGYGLFPNIKGDNDRIPYDYLMGFSDGNHTLVEIAEMADIPVYKLDTAVQLMEEKGLITKRNSKS